MKSILYALLAVAAFLLASCSTPPPRAIIPAPSEIRQLNVHPVTEAGDKTREAVRKVAEAGEKTRAANAKVKSTSERLKEEINRTEKLAEANSELKEAFARVQRLAFDLSNDLVELTAALALAEEKERIAITTIDDQDREIAKLSANVLAQKAEITHASLAQETLREQVEALAAYPDKLAKAEQRADTLKSWVWRLGILSAALAVIIALLAYLLFKP